MRLYGTMMSPYVRKARVALREKGLDCRFVILNVMEPESPVVAHNPLGKVPVMVLDDGSEIFDSRVIVEYIDASSAGTRLIPENPLERAIVRRHEALADGVIEAGSLARVEMSRAPESRSHAQLDRQMGKLTRGLAAMSTQVDNRSWCCLDSFTLADIAFTCTLGWLDFRFPDLGWRATHPRLAQYYEKISARPSFAATAPTENPSMPSGSTLMVPLAASRGTTP